MTTMVKSDHLRDVFPNMAALASIGLVIPVSTAGTYYASHV